MTRGPAPRTGRAAGVLRRAVLGFWLLKLGVLVHNLRAFPVLRTAPGAAPARRGRVSLLVPVRDETDRIADTLGSIAAQDVDELLLLDDCSTDGTAAAARALLAGHPHARVIEGDPQPGGWVGKSWACHQLAAAASGGRLVFVDVDVALAPGAVTAALAEADRQGADVFSVFPRQVVGSLGEAVLVPFLDEVLLTGLPFALLGLDEPAAVRHAAAANGSLVVCDRDAYARLGGHESVRHEIIEDVPLARRTRALGMRLGLALGGDLVSTRMYPGYRAAVTGLARGMVGVALGSRTGLVVGLGWHLVAQSAPLVLAARDRRWALPALLSVLCRGLVAHRTRPGREWEGLLGPLAPLAATPVVVGALRPGRTWRGRALP
ncbi:glycosyltransferase family 2 protein [Rhodococcus aerolatus]